MNPERLRAMWPATRHERWMAEECEAGLVSVVVPTYDRAGLLVEALDSVRAQTYRPIELLIVDDGSTDDTGGVVEEWRAACAGDDGLTVRYFRQENAGAPAARNRGLIESAGEYVQFLDSDDLLHPAKLAVHVPALAGDDALDFVYSATTHFTTTLDWEVEPRAGLRLGGEDPLLGFLRGARGTRPPACIGAPPAAFSARGTSRRPSSRTGSTGSGSSWAIQRSLTCRARCLPSGRGGTDRVTARRLSEASMRGRLLQRVQWLGWIREAGRLDGEVEMVLAGQIYAVAHAAVEQGYVKLARAAFALLASLRLPDGLGREAAVFALSCQIAGAVRAAGGTRVRGPQGGQGLREQLGVREPGLPAAHRLSAAAGNV